MQVEKSPVTKHKCHSLDCWSALTVITFRTAATCDFQQCGIFITVDSDEPVQPPFKLRNSKWCSVSNLIFIE